MRKLSTAVVGVAALGAVALGAAGCSGGGSSGEPAQPESNPPATQQHQAKQHKAAAKPEAKKKAPAHKKQAKTVTFKVAGNAPSGVDVTYGSDSDSRQGASSPPWQATMPRDDSGGALYYAVTAQLQGGGDVTCQVLVGNTVVATGHASGGYNICRAQVGQNPLTGKWTKE